ncbi:hypothetical protein C2E23DRAFT_822448 [Lenzites betulinus]|nr:hypothetical protein C2E23DRAFT_822448 [Lenzites betulinus]
MGARTVLHCKEEHPAFIQCDRPGAFRGIISAATYPPRGKFGSLVGRGVRFSIRPGETRPTVGQLLQLAKLSL